MEPAGEAARGTTAVDALIGAAWPHREHTWLATGMQFDISSCDKEGYYMRTQKVQVECSEISTQNLTSLLDRVLSPTHLAYADYR